MNLPFTRPARARAPRLLASGLAALSLSAAAVAQHTQRVSVDSSGVEGNHASDQLALTPDARFVCFSTTATNLASGDTNSWADVYVRDRLLGTTTWVSSGPGGIPGNGDSRNPAISPDGRFVVFDTYAGNLVPGDSAFVADVILWDRQVGTLEAISVPTGSTQPVGGQLASLSSDGRFVAFTSRSSGLVPGDTNGCRDVFVRDRRLGTTERISVGPGGIQGNGETYFGRPGISADGRFVVFTSAASNLVPGDTNGKRDVFLHDRSLGTSEIVSDTAVGAAGDGHCSLSTVSADGRYVLFESESTNLVPIDMNHSQDVYLRDLVLGTVERIDLDSVGFESSGPCYLGYPPQISADGRFVTFSGSASNLVSGDTNGASDAFLRDRVTGTTERVSLSSAGIEGGADSSFPAVSSDGRFVGFVSAASNLVPGDTNQSSDVFVRDRHATSFTAFCDPGAGGVIPCPCANPPSGAGRGCDNFGAGPTDSGTLSATGAAYLVEDTVVLQLSGENDTSLSVFFTGTATAPGGIELGAGVRCVSSGLRRLYTGLASGGSVARPGPGDPSVSARTAIVGSSISPGETRYYFGIYRDPLAAGPCGNPASTVNATSAGAITWTW